MEEKTTAQNISRKNALQKQIDQVTNSLKEWQLLRHQVGNFPDVVDQKQTELEQALADYRLFLSELNYKAIDTDRRVWELFDHIENENQRLNTETNFRPLMFRRIKDLRALEEAWQRLSIDQQGLLEMLEKAPTELGEFNQKQLQREKTRQDESRRVEYSSRIAAARRSLDLAMGYIDQLNREGRVTFGSTVLQLEDAQNFWSEKMTEIIDGEKSGAANPDQIVLGIYNLETLIREAPGLSMRIREVEEKFSRMITKHDMLVSYGKTIISQKEVARMTVKLNEQVPQLWATGQRDELDHALEVLENFISTYDGTIEAELNYLERRRPGLTRSLTTAGAVTDDNVLGQMNLFARSLITAIDSRDRFMRGHSEAVSRLAVQMARSANWTKNDIDYLAIAGLLHDVGKISISEAILSKTSPLSNEDWQAIQMHPFYGAQMIKPVEALSRIVPWIYHHQERWDGHGYPDHLSAKQIPMPAAFLSAAEAFSVMTIDTPSHEAMNKEDALQAIKKEAGTQFSPEAVETLEAVIKNEIKEDRSAEQ